MERQNPADILFSSAFEHRFECAHRTQLDIDVFSVRQKAQKQFSAFFQREIVSASFAGIARGDDNRCAEDRHLALELSECAAEMIESNLKQVRRFAGGDCKPEIGGRSDYANQLW